MGEIVNNSAAAPLPEQLLHLRTADEIVTADLLNGKLTGQMIFQIGEQTFIHISICPGFVSGGHSLLPDEADEELLQIKLDHLKTAEGSILGKLHFFGIRIIQRSGKTPPGFGENAGDQTAFRFSDAKGFGTEKVHIWRITGKGNHNEIWRGLAVGLYRMKFIRLVENDFILFQRECVFSRRYDRLSLVHTQKFPEIVAFAGKEKVVHIFKIMHGVNLINADGGRKKNRTVIRLCILFLRTVIDSACHVKVPLPVFRLSSGWDFCFYLNKFRT